MDEKRPGFSLAHADFPNSDGFSLLIFSWARCESARTFLKSVFDRCEWTKNERQTETDIVLAFPEGMICML